MILMQPRSCEQHLNRSLVSTRDNLKVILYTTGAFSTQKTSPISEAIKAIRLIYEKSNLRPLIIPLSGGVDSECVAISCILGGVPFTPVIMKFAHKFNEFDIKWAFRFCAANNLKPIVLDLDLQSFYESGQHLSYAQKYGCRSPQLATHLWMMDQVDGQFVFPYNPVPLLRNKSGKIYIGFPAELQLCYDRYLDLNKREGLGLFFTYTADLIYSFLRLPLYQEMLFNSNHFFNFYSSNYYLTKCELLQSGGFKVRARPDKATGFELFREFLNEKYNSKNSDFYDVHYRKPMELIVMDPCLLEIGNIDFEKLFNLWSQSKGLVMPVINK